MFMTPVYEFERNVIKTYPMEIPGRKPGKYRKPPPGKRYKYPAKKYLRPGRKMKPRAAVQPTYVQKPQPMHRYDLPVAKMTSKVATKLILRTATKLNPYLRVASTLWDLYGWWNTGPYEWMSPAGGGKLTGFVGFTTRCGGPDFKPGKYGVGFTSVFNGPEYPALCGLSGQVPRSFDAAGLPNNQNTVMVGPAYFWSGSGAGIPSNYRMAIAWQLSRPIVSPFKPIVPVFAPAYAMPMPATLRPMESVPVVEAKAEPSSPPYLPPPRTPDVPAYAEPAIEYGPFGPRVTRHIHARPSRGKPEKKVKLIGPIGSALAAGFHALTEWKDFVESIHAALPKKYQSKDKGLLPMENAIWKHFDKIDWDEAARNVLWNWVEDKIIGDLHGAQKKKFDKIYAKVRGKNGVRLGGYEPRFAPPN